jgi:FlaA1/EpsC-like NDP-sugar epimerase
VLLVNVAVVAVAFVRYGGRIPGQYGGRRALAALALITLAYTAFVLSLRTYRTMWRFATLRDMAALGVSVAGAFGLVALVEITLLQGYRPVPLSVLGLGGAMAYLVLAHFKLLPRARLAVSPDRTRTPMIVFGAGLGGISLVRQLAHERTGYRPVAFVDDDGRKVGRTIAGLPVAGTRADLARVVKQYRAQAVAIAIPSAHSTTIRELTLLALDANARALALPPITELMAGSQLTLHDVGIEEIVGRTEVTVDDRAIAETFGGNRVLVTGAAGSIGSEVARQIASLGPSRLDLLDNNESGLADLRDELSVFGIDIALSVVDILHRDTVERAFATARPDVVIHAAALKHVDIVEEQPRRAVEVNVRGTWLCARAAERAGARRFIFVSTDKAVDPMGVLGSTKRIGELMMATKTASATVFSAVRFGNVLGSRGSVLPKFERQIREGGPLTVTHPDVKRYFMSIVEAVRLILQATSFAERGNVYILDMGEELSIAAFARRLVQLRGLRVPEDIQIAFTGLRPGERLRERLVGDREQSLPTAHPKVMAVKISVGMAAQEWDEVVEDLSRMEDSHDAAALRSRLLQLADERFREPAEQPRALRVTDRLSSG